MKQLARRPVGSRTATSTRGSAPTGVLRLQRLIGNRATVHLLQRAVPTVQRWGAKEHELLGGKGSGHRDVELAPGYRLTFGEVVALGGDHFESIDQMRTFAANTKGGPGSRAEIEYALHWKLDKPGRTWDDKAKVAQENRYYDLAGANRSHFLNPESGDAEKDPSVRAGSVSDYLDPKYTKAPQNASQAYRMNHVHALREAVDAAHRRGSLDQAMATEAFGAHFLTDAFASGHLRTPRVTAKEYWDAKVPMFPYNLTHFIAESIAPRLDVIQKVKGVPVPTTTELRYGGVTGTGGAIEIIQDMMAHKRFTFGDMVALAIHDWDNAKGVLARSGRADNLRLRGDGSLTKDDDDAMPYAIKAVGEGVAEIETAFALGHQGKQLNDVLGQLCPEGLFAPETWLPVVKPDADQPAESKSIAWRFDRVEGLFADERFRGAVELFLKEKKNDLAEVAGSLSEPDQQAAFRAGVIEPLEKAPIPTLLAVVNWTPQATGGKRWDAEYAADYVHDARKVPGGLGGLTIQQRIKLIGRLQFHAYNAPAELMSVLSTAPDNDARQLIRLFKWERLHGAIDAQASPFATRFPRKSYGP